MKIYDCFPFYNELDLLELRLCELYDHVDYFVLVEANTTFTSRPKPYYYEENALRYQQWADKIIHIKVSDMPGDTNPWVNDIYQRDQIARGIVNANPDDLVIISDLDEITRPAAVEHMRQSSNNLFALRMPQFNFKFNYMRSHIEPYVVWGMATKRSLLDHIQPDALRQMRFQFFDRPLNYQQDDVEVVEHAGWHFGYMGDNQWLRDKAQSFAHQEINYPEFVDNIDLETSIANRMHWGNYGEERYTIVKLDSYFPETLTKNQEQYQPWILPDFEVRALDILPEYKYNT